MRRVANQTAGAADDAETKPSPGRVLVADGDARQRRMTAIVLRLAGYEVSETGQGLNVLMDGRRGAFDVVVTETRLVDGDGVDLVRAIRNQPETKTLPVLVHTSDRDRQAAIEELLGPEGFLAKPAGPSDLAERVAQLRGRGRPPGGAAGTAA